MDDAKTQLLDTLKTANNILVTVSRNPSVDQLSALLGLTLLLNKQGKHAAAVFSGEVPSTLEFLQPEETIEKNTDSLRDFIIALDKQKADKLRYKVEDDVVRIFITPYKTSITQDDFDFSQGDFNVDLVIAIGVQQQEDLDEAITSHGRILHDATVTSINTSIDGGLGAINWHEPTASSLSELVTKLIQAVDVKLLDEQIATALLTGIVAETDRFRNEKTSAETMSASAALMAAGANQQLVASKLEEPAEAPAKPDDSDEMPEHDGGIEIDHEESTEPAIELPTPDENSQPEPEEEVEAQAEEKPADEAPAGMPAGPKLVTEPPTMGGVLTANSSDEKLDPVTDPLSMPTEEEPKLLDHKTESPPQFTPPPPAWEPPASPTPQDVPAASPPPEPGPLSFNSTLSDDPNAGVTPPQPASEADLGTARDEVSRALTGSENTAPAPIQALSAQPMVDNLNTAEPTTAPQVNDPTAPPPVPPPIPFRFGNPPASQ